MSDETTAARRLRRLLEEPGIIRSMGAHDVLTALLIERAGFETVFLGGFGASASLRGLPDLNFLELEEMAAAVERMARRISIPLIADGDTGYGGPAKVRECVRAFEDAGAAGILLEDQVFPKRCGHFDGNSVIPAEEMVAKLEAALEARRPPAGPHEVRVAGVVGGSQDHLVPGVHEQREDQQHGRRAAAGDEDPRRIHGDPVPRLAILRDGLAQLRALFLELVEHRGRTGPVKTRLRRPFL